MGIRTKLFLYVCVWGGGCPLAIITEQFYAVRAPLSVESLSRAGHDTVWTADRFPSMAWDLIVVHLQTSLPSAAPNRSARCNTYIGTRTLELVPGV